MQMGRVASGFGWCQLFNSKPPECKVSFGNCPSPEQISGATDFHPWCFLDSFRGFEWILSWLLLELALFRKVQQHRNRLFPLGRENPVCSRLVKQLPWLNMKIKEAALWGAEFFKRSHLKSGSHDSPNQFLSANGFPMEKNAALASFAVFVEGPKENTALASFAIFVEGPP